MTGLAEFVLDFGPGYRIYYGNISDTHIIILLGGVKKSQERDIEKAKDYWLGYKRNNKL